VNWIWNVRAFTRREDGQDLIEYALLVGLISLVAVAALTLTGTNVNAIFDSIQQKLAAAT
jgi:pilus assembly protein Flp/PilA